MKRQIFKPFKLLMIVFTLSLLAACSSEQSIYVPNKYSDISAYNPLHYQEAYAYFKARAAHGDANAMDNLGHMYADGRGVKQDPVEAVKWYQKAAYAGDADAALNMGVACLYGNGTTKDINEACKWFKRAKTTHNTYAGQFFKKYC